MKKVIIILFIILSTMSFAKKINFTVVYTGNFNGNFEELPSIYSYINGIKNEKKNVLKIDGGNNLSGVETVDKNFIDYYNKSEYDFYLAGKNEVKNNVYLRKELKLSTINIEQENILPYRTMRIEDFSIAVIGITDVYSVGFEKIKTYDYRKEMKKLLLKLDDIVDFIFVVSELRRDENIEILKNNKNIAAVFESGKNYEDKEIIKLGYSFLIPNDNLMYVEFAYNKEGAALLNRYKEEYLIKNVFIESSRNRKEIQFYKQDVDLLKKQEWQKDKAEKLEKEIIGENKEEFDIQEVPLGRKIKFLDEIGSKLRRFYNADFTVIPVKALKSGMKKGFYSKKDLEGVFSKEKIIKFKVSSKELSKLYEVSKNNIGQSSYLYFFQAGEKETKDEYTIVSTENIFEDYEKTKMYGLEIKKTDVAKFLSEVNE